MVFLLVMNAARRKRPGLRLQLLAKEEWIAAHALIAWKAGERPCVR
jgi:hypothetical protein